MHAWEYLDPNLTLPQTSSARQKGRQKQLGKPGARGRDSNEMRFRCEAEGDEVRRCFGWRHR